MIFYLERLYKMLCFMVRVFFPKPVFDDLYFDHTRNHFGAITCNYLPFQLGLILSLPLIFQAHMLNYSQWNSLSLVYAEVLLLQTVSSSKDAVVNFGSPLVSHTCTDSSQWHHPPQCQASNQMSRFPWN